MADTLAKFVSKKISKIRWRPTLKQMIQDADVFATGSWDDYVNHVSIWSLSEKQSPAAEPGLLPVAEGEPELICEAVHVGDVTDMEFVGMEHILVASSSGSLSVYKYTSHLQELAVSRRWDKLHHYGAKQSPCTGLATRGDETVVTIGEDGRLNMLSLDHKEPVRVIEKADSCSLNSVTFLKQHEVGAVNSSGQLKVWDLRQAADQPVQTFLLSGKRVPLHCLDKHPSQPHIVATGGQESTMSIWDMRHDKFPVTLLCAHSADMWEVRFHPSDPDHIFTCSEDGSVWHWNGTSMNAQVGLQHKSGHIHNTNVSMSMNMSNSNTSTVSSYTSPWLASDASKHRLDVTDVLPGNTMPVNSLDIESNTLLCGTDGEQIYTVKDLAIR